jgi:hypothetical protein
VFICWYFVFWGLFWDGTFVARASVVLLMSVYFRSLAFVGVCAVCVRSGWRWGSVNSLANATANANSAHPLTQPTQPNTTILNDYILYFNSIL